MEVLPYDKYVVQVDGSRRLTTRNRRFLKLYSPMVTRLPIVNPTLNTNCNYDDEIYPSYLGSSDESGAAHRKTKDNFSRQRSFGAGSEEIPPATPSIPPATPSIPPATPSIPTARPSIPTARPSIP